MSTIKDKQALLANSIWSANDHTAHCIKELLNLLLEQAKIGLIDSSGDDTLRRQGGAQAIAKILKMVSETPVSITPKG